MNDALALILSFILGAVCEALRRRWRIAPGAIEMALADENERLRAQLAAAQRRLAQAQGEREIAALQIQQLALGLYDATHKATQMGGPALRLGTGQVDSERVKEFIDYIARKEVQP